jgi:chloramphenicol O-acetyltransferase type A
MASPHFNLCAPVDISSFLSHIKTEGLPFSSCIVYAIAKTANAIPQFRWRIRKDKVIEHELVHPSFSVPCREEDVFSFCEVPYQDHLPSFLETADQKIRERFDEPIFEDEAGRDDYLFLSAIPWVSFSSLQHAMPMPADSVPRISWGKYYELGEKVLMPLSIQAHHAIVDGKHTGQFFHTLQALLSNFPVSTHS